jgi:hypothetical protein
MGVTLDFGAAEGIGEGEGGEMTAEACAREDTDGGFHCLEAAV